MKLSVYILFFLLVGAVQAQEEIVEVPQIGISLELGETVEFDGVQLRFAQVLEDSRCPRTVQCIWAGRVRIKLEVRSRNGETVFQEIIFGELRNGESANRMLFPLDQGTLIVKMVYPYPENPGDQLEYRLLLGVEKE